MNYYQRYLRKIDRGVESAPRGMPVHALLNETFVFEPGTCWRRPHDNPAIGFIEGLQFIAGMADKEAIKAVAPNVDIELFGPVSFYGPRTVGQFERAIAELKLHPDSRRAVVTIVHPDDMPYTIPCTLSMNFYNVPNSEYLGCTIAARSNDAVWGMPYDMIQYGMVHIAVANCIGRKPGETIVNICNAHIYEDHNGGTIWSPYKFTMPNFPTWDAYTTWAKAIVEFHPTAKELREHFFLQEVGQ